MIHRFLSYVIIFFIASTALMNASKAQLIGSKYSFGKSPFSIEFGVKYNYHYNFETQSILTPPRIIFVGAQVGYIMDSWLMPYLEFNGSVSEVTGRTFFFGIKAFVFKQVFSKSSQALFRSAWLSMNIDYGYVSIAPPVAPQVYVPSEWLYRYGMSFMMILGKGKSFIDVTGLLYNESMSNLMTSVAFNFGFLLN